MGLNTFKYFCFTFLSAHTFQVDCNVIKIKLYVACNSIFCHSRRNCKLVRLYIIKSVCLPLLTHCLCAIVLPRYAIKEMVYAGMIALENIWLSSLGVSERTSVVSKRTPVWVHLSSASIDIDYQQISFWQTFYVDRYKQLFLRV